MKKQKGILAKDMSLADLRDLVVSLKLSTVKEAGKLKSKELLSIIGVFEAEHKAKKIASVVKASKEAVNVEEVDMFEGKKVISRTNVEINGKSYENVLVESGEIYTNLIK